MDRGFWLRTVDRRSAGSADAPGSYSGNERRELPPHAKQEAQTTCAIRLWIRAVVATALVESALRPPLPTTTQSPPQEANLGAHLPAPTGTLLLRPAGTLSFRR